MRRGAPRTEGARKLDVGEVIHSTDILKTGYDVKYAPKHVVGKPVTVDKYGRYFRPATHDAKVEPFLTVMEID